GDGSRHRLGREPGTQSEDDHGREPRPEEVAADVAEENTGSRHVERREPDCGARHDRTGDGHTADVLAPPDGVPGAPGDNRLGDGDTVDPVHEVEGVCVRDQPQDRPDDKCTLPKDAAVESGEHPWERYPGRDHLEAEAKQWPNAHDVLDKADATEASARRRDRRTSVSAQA